MKTFFATIALFLVLGSAGFAQSNSGNDQRLIGIANGALRAQCSDATGTLNASVRVVSACFVDGLIHKVTFYRTPNCPPNRFCIQVIETVGSVTLDCGDNVTNVTCGPFVTQ